MPLLMSLFAAGRPLDGSFGIRGRLSGRGDDSQLLKHFGEPFADSSAIPTYHLSRVTREGVTVALSGDRAMRYLA